MFEVEIRQTSARRLAGMRHVGAYHRIGETYEKILAWAARKGVFGPRTEIVGVYHDDPDSTPVDRLRSEACVTAPAGFDGDDEVSIVELAGGECAVGTLVGPYQDLRGAYEWLFRTWLPKNGRAPADAPCFEVCRNLPADTPPEELITEIYIPLR